MEAATSVSGILETYKDFNFLGTTMRVERQCREAGWGSGWKDSAEKQAGDLGGKTVQRTSRAGDLKDSAEHRLGIWDSGREHGSHKLRTLLDRSKLQKNGSWKEGP
jgi:hypothetical protein